MKMIDDAFVARGASPGMAARDILNNHSEEAANALVSLMQSSQSEGIKHKSIVDILNRTGVTQEGGDRPQTNINITITNEQAAMALQAKAAVTKGES
jgi:hypothetical protein